MNRIKALGFSWSAIVAGLCAAVAVSACNDITAPTASPSLVSVPTSPAAVVASTGAIVVSPTDMKGWRFTDELTGGPCRSEVLCHFIAGPGTPPLGTGSAELTSILIIDGTLALNGYASVPFSRITTLSYSTYRQSIDPTNNLAVSLQVNVDYDLSDNSKGDMGRLVYEPYRSNKGKVLRTTWQDWDTKTGLWWGTEEYVRVGGKSVKNRCAESTPCTWTQLLSRYPKSGFHSNGGGVVLKARKTLLFRGNVDKLVIGVMDSTTTTYDFELTAASHNVAAKRIVVAPDTTIAGAPLRDTTAMVGEVISYAYTAKPGFTDPQVFVDGHRAPLSGTIIADTVVHTISITANRLVTVPAGLEGLYATAHEVMTVPNVPAAFQNWIDAVAAHMERSGYTELAARQIKDIEFLAFNPTREMANLVRMDHALAGWSFRVGPDDLAPSGAPIITGPCDTMVCQNRVNPKGGSTPSGPRSIDASAPADTIETTTFIYMNGILTLEYNAAITSLELRRIVKAVPGFESPRITTRYRYNKTYTETGATESERLGTCIMFAANSDVYGRNNLPDYLSQCMGQVSFELFSELDLVECFNQVLSIIRNTDGLYADAKLAANDIIDLRKRGRHVIVVPHSQGNLMMNQALNYVGNLRDSTGMSVVSLASPVSDRWTVPDTNVAKIVVRGDPVAGLGFNDWPVTDTRQSREVDEVANRILAAGSPEAVALSALYRLYKGLTLLHSVDKSYFKEEALVTVNAGVRRAYVVNVVDHLVSSEIIVPVGTVFSGQFLMVNFMGEPVGRSMSPSDVVSQNTSVAAPNGGLNFKAVGVGTTDIIGTHNGKTATMHVTVIDPLPPPIVGLWEGTWQDQSESSKNGPMNVKVYGNTASAVAEFTWRDNSTDINYEGSIGSFITSDGLSLARNVLHYHRLGDPIFSARQAQLEVRGGGMIGVVFSGTGVGNWSLSFTRAFVQPLTQMPSNGAQATTAKQR